MKRLKATLREVILGLIGFMVILIPFFALEAYLGEIITLILFLISFAAYVFFTFIIMGSFLTSDFFKMKLEEAFKKEKGSFFFAIFFLQFLFFSILCRCIYILYGPGNYEYLPPSASMLTWILFALKNLLGVLTCGFFDTFGLGISDVENAKNIWMSSLIFSYNISISLGMINILFAAIKKLRSN